MLMLNSKKDNMNYDILSTTKDWLFQNLISIHFSHLKKTLCFIWCGVGYILLMSADYQGNSLGILWKFYGNSLGIFWEFFGNSLKNLNCTLTQNCECDMKWCKFWLKERQDRTRTTNQILRSALAKSRLKKLNFFS